MIRSMQSQTIRPTRTATALAAFVVLTLAAVMLLAASGCGGEDSNLVVRRGRSLEIHATIPEVVDKVAYVGGVDGRHRVIRPVASNRRIAVTEVTIVNRTTTVVPLLVDGTAAELGDRRSRRVEAIDPVEQAELLDDADPDANKYTPFLWGEIELPRDRQVKGWMVFDVPQGLTLGTLWWNEVDDVLLDFIDYRR